MRSANREGWSAIKGRAPQIQTSQKSLREFLPARAPGGKNSRLRAINPEDFRNTRAHFLFGTVRANGRHEDGDIVVLVSRIALGAFEPMTVALVPAAPACAANSWAVAMPANPVPASTPRRDGADGVQYVSCISVGRAWHYRPTSLAPSLCHSPARRCGRERTAVYLGLARPNPPAAADYTVLTELERWVLRFPPLAKGLAPT